MDSKRVLISWGFFVVFKAVESNSQQSLTVTNERIKGYFHGDARPVREIPFNDATKVYRCPAVNCRTSSKYKHNILKHLKSCYQVNSNKKVADNNKTCSISHKHFLKKSNRDRHMKTVHQNDSKMAHPDENVQHLNDDEHLDEELPSMVYNVTNQSQVSAIEIESKVSISFQPSGSGIVCPFPTLEPCNLPAASCSSFPTDPTAALTAALSSSFPTNPPAALSAASFSSFERCLIFQFAYRSACCPDRHLISQSSIKELAFRTLPE